MNPKLISMIKKISVIVLIILLLVWIGGAIYIYTTGEKRIFFPERQEDINFTTNFEQHYKTDSNGKKIGIQFYPKAGSEEVIIYFHGNFGRLQRVLEPLTEYANVVSPSLQGYAESEGSPNYYNVFEVADLTINFLREKGYRDDQITIYGHSLGGTFAVYTAKKYPTLKKLIVVASFSSLFSLCWKQASILCISSIHIMNSSQMAKEVKIQTRIYHSKEDETIPFEEGKMLFENIGSTDKKIIEIEGQHSYYDIGKTIEN